MIRTGIYGGSFNPIHLGHTGLGEWLCRHGWVDELWFLVSPLNPLKAGVQEQLLDDETRLHLAQLAVEGKPMLQASDFEMHLPRPSYMVNTLAALTEAYPDRAFTLIIGADNWQCFHLWKDYDFILQNYPIIIYPRQGYSINTATLPPNVKIATDAPLFDISSTQIRQQIAQGGYRGKWLARKVWQEMRRQSL